MCEVVKQNSNIFLSPKRAMNMLKYKQGAKFLPLVVGLMMTNTCIKFEQHPLSNSADNSNVKHNFNIVLSPEGPYVC